MHSFDCLDRFEKFLKFALWYINPYATVDGQRRLPKRVVRSHCVQLVAWLSSIFYAVNRFSLAGHAEKAELLATALVLGRCVCYCSSMFVLHSRVELAIGRIIDERKSMRSSPEASSLALKYSRVEFVLSMVLLVYIGASSVFMWTSPMFAPSNQIAVPYNFKIPFLPYDGISVNWMLTYYCHVLFTVIILSFYCLFLSLFLHIMDHSCWELDDLIIIVEKCCVTSQDHDRNNQTSNEALNRQLESIVDRSCSFLDWHNQARDLLKFIFLLDFTLQAFLSGLCLATLSSDAKASSYVIMLLLITMPQLTVNCWMGERVLNRIEKLTVAIYDLPWYLMSVKQRKEVQMILIMSQNMQGFNGVFNEVNMETFQAILNFTYSFFTLLKSTK